MQSNINWPDGKRFAFTVFDDTDLTTVENGPPVYQLLYDLGFRTTKSVWPVQGKEVPPIGGSTCEDPEYLEWVQKLKDQGFEIALHNVTFHTATREEIIEGLNKFEELFGAPPNIHVNHAGCEDAIYWGDARLTGMNRLIYKALSRFIETMPSSGHVESSELFWGDLCQQKVKYVRNFVFSDINTLNTCPFMPYHDKKRPFANNWFASSEGANCAAFNQTISEENQDRLEEEGGACIMYTHFGSDFYQNGELNSRFKELMERLSQKQGWFVPVSTLLDYITQERGPHTISGRERTRLERQWLMHKIFVTRGTT